jgi:glycosyltransferase involved in cell wall biosynthesis
MTAPAVSIVVPTRNKASRLRPTLACLAEQRLPASAMEVVLVDDGSVDNTQEVVAEAEERLPLRVVSGPGAGRAAARNRGATHSRGEYLVFLDDDILVAPDFVAAHLAAARKNRFVHGPLRELASAEHLVAELAEASPNEVCARRDAVLAGTAGRRHRLFSNALERAVAALATGEVPDVAPWLGSVGANVGVHRTAWQAVGGFDEGFGTTWGCEDLEFGLRLHLAGLRRTFEERARGIHLTHRRPDRWDQHSVNLDRFRMVHPVPSVQHLDLLLGPDGDVGRYVAAVTEADARESA